MVWILKFATIATRDIFRLNARGREAKKLLLYILSDKLLPEWKLAAAQEIILDLACRMTPQKLLCVVCHGRLPRNCYYMFFR